MKRDWERCVRDYYQQRHLSAASLARMMAQTQRTATSRPVWRMTWPRWAISSVLLVVLTFSVVHFSGPSRVDALTASVAREVALNHEKALALEFQTQDYDSLTARMDKLDFSLRFPTRLMSSGLILQGGRYCSIQGQLAAQLTFSDAAGRRFTLYQTRTNEALLRLLEDSDRIGNIYVEKWREKDAFYALAHDASVDQPAGAAVRP